MAPLASGGDLAWWRYGSGGLMAGFEPNSTQTTEYPQPWTTWTLELSSSLLEWVLSCPNHIKTSGKTEDRNETWVYSVKGNLQAVSLLGVLSEAECVVGTRVGSGLRQTWAASGPVCRPSSPRFPHLKMGGNNCFHLLNL